MTSHQPDSQSVESLLAVVLLQTGSSTITARTSGWRRWLCMTTKQVRLKRSLPSSRSPHDQLLENLKINTEQKSTECNITANEEYKFKTVKQMKEECNIFVCKSSNTFSGYEFLKFSFRVLFSPQENPWHELEKSLQLYKHLTLLRHLFVFSRFSRRRRDILRPRWHHHQHRDDRRGLVARRVQRRLRPFPSQLRGGSTMMTPRWDDLCPRPCAKKKKKKKTREEMNLLLFFPFHSLVFSLFTTSASTLRDVLRSPSSPSVAPFFHPVASESKFVSLCAAENRMSCRRVIQYQEKKQNSLSGLKGAICKNVPPAKFRLQTNWTFFHLTQILTP